MTENPEVIILHETVAQSWSKVIATYLFVVAVIGTGAVLGSVPMQWIGFAMVCLVGISRASRTAKRISPQAAADYLADRFGVVGRKA